MYFIFTYYISNKREFNSPSDSMNNYIIKVSLEKMLNKNLFFTFYFNKDFSLYIEVKLLEIFIHVKNITMEGSVSHFFFLLI